VSLHGCLQRFPPVAAAAVEAQHGEGVQRFLHHVVGAPGRVRVQSRDQQQVCGVDVAVAVDHEEGRGDR